MPTGSLPAEGKKLYESVYQDALKRCKGDKKTCQQSAAKQAWSVVKKKYAKGSDGKWHRKADVEFSMSITKASYDKTTGERRWLATASDTELDSFGDKMSMELFHDFCDRIKREEQAPEDFRSEFWSGGMPYLSVSHYPDLDGLAVPGPLDEVFIDGNKFKSKGRFHDTPLGIASYNAIKKDIVEKSPDPVRISIAFLDYKHRHLSNGYEFERSLSDPDKMICPECIKEMLTGEYGGREFLRGMLVHEAMTRVPVNKRTDMEVERAMTTRKEDAASIIGEELADELDEKAKMVGKSEALIIKAEDEEVPDDIEAEESEEVEITEEEADRWDEVLAALSEMKSEFHDLMSVLRGKAEDKKKKDEDMDETDEEDEEYKKKKQKKEDKSEVVVEPQPDLIEAFRSALSDTNQRLDILISAMSQNIQSGGVPQRRSMVPPPNYAPPVPPVATNPNAPKTIGEFVRNSV